MKCLYCDNEIKTYTLYDLFVEQDCLCNECRTNMCFHHQKFKLNDLDVESFYDYNSLFKDLLLQYKECYDEALKDIFLFKIIDYLKIKYHDYALIYVPSSKQKTLERGFNHLKQIYGNLNLKKGGELIMLNEYSQQNKNYKEREQMLKNYQYKGNRLKKALIVDDVCTSGSSLLGAYYAIKDNCKYCKAIVLAKT